MPWSPKSFAKKHNQKLHGEAATKAAHVATALVEKGEDEGKAIRIGNSVGDKAMSRNQRMKQNMYKKKEK